MSPRASEMERVAPIEPSLEQASTSFEGVTVFKAPPAPTYRYKLSLKQGNLRVWLENRETKEQWCTSELGLDNFVGLDNCIIPGATAADYAECFHELLSGATSNLDNICSSFQQKDDTVLLQMAVKSQVLNKARVASFSFTLQPISVERIDVLESKMRDLQEEVKALRLDTAGLATADVQDEVKQLRQELAAREAALSKLEREVKTLRAADHPPLVVQTKANTMVPNSSVIQWGLVGVGDKVNGIDGMIRDLEPGTYQVSAVVTCLSNGFDCLVELKKGFECIQTGCCYGKGHGDTTSLMCVTHITKGDTLSVCSNAQLSKTSYITLIRLGA